MKKYKMYLQYWGGCQYDNRVWFVNGTFNGLFSIDLKDFSTQFIGKIPFLQEEYQWAYKGIANCYYKNKIFFFPDQCDKILVYDIGKGAMQEIQFPSTSGSEKYMTAGIVQCDDFVWIFPYKLTFGVFVLDMKTLSLNKSSELDEALAGVEYISNIGNVIKLNEMEVAILSGNNTIVWINIQTMERKYCKCFEDSLDIFGMKCDGNSFWLLSYNTTDVYEWNQSEDRLIRYQLLQEEWINGKGTPYANIIFLDNQIVLLPCSLKNIMKIDKATNSIRKAAEYPEKFLFFKDRAEWAAFGGFSIIDSHRVLLYPNRGNMLLIFDFTKNQLEGIEQAVCDMEIPYLNKIVEFAFAKAGGKVIENETWGLRILDLAVNYNCENENKVSKGQMGSAIHTALMT